MSKALVFTIFICTVQVFNISSYHVAIPSGCTSHLFATLPLAKLFIEHGHEVTYVAPVDCEERILEIGAKLYERENWNMLADIELQGNILQMFKANRDKLWNWQIEPARELSAWLSSIHEKPDLIISHPMALLTSTYADHYDIPFVLFHSNGFAIPSKEHIALSRELEPYISKDNLIHKMLAQVQWVAYVYLSAYSYSLDEVNSQRADFGFAPFGSIYHIWRSYPVITPFASPLVEHGDSPHIHKIALFSGTKSTHSLEKELISWITSSTIPIIYMALGTSTYLDYETIQMFISSFKEQSHFRLLWGLKKGKDVNLEFENSEKFFVKEFLPQIEVLQRQEVVGFLTHCGGGSLIEAIQNLKPMILFPQKRDQFMFASNLHKAKIGIYMEKPLQTTLLRFRDQQKEMKNNLVKVRERMGDIGGWPELNNLVESLIAKQSSSLIKVDDLFESLLEFWPKVILAVAICFAIVSMYIFYKLCKCMVNCCKQRVKVKQE